MTSLRKMLANQRNARMSTGPKSKFGRVRSAKNAVRHGLNLPIDSVQVEVLASQIAGPDAGSELKDVARRVAETQLALLRARQKRHWLLLCALQQLNLEPELLNGPPALSRSVCDEDTEEFIQRVNGLNLKPPEKSALLLLDRKHGLEAIDRYERRAFSRRTRAIWAFDVARARQHTGFGALLRDVGSD